MLHKLTRSLISIVLALLLLTMGGCSVDKIKEPVEYARRALLVNDTDGKPIESPETLYERGMAAIQGKEPKLAIKLMDEIGELYPFSKLAQSATLISGYLNYKLEHYSVAEATAENFISSYVAASGLSYAYYLKAMSQYQQIRSISHDHAIAAKTYSSMLELATRFPNSVYARDVEDRMMLVRYYLAAKDVDVGRFYMKTRQYLPALMRFNNYLTNYPDTFYTPEILYRLIVCSEVLGLRREAVRYYALLTYNFPYSYWRKETDKFLELPSRRDVKVANGVVAGE